MRKQKITKTVKETKITYKYYDKSEAKVKESTVLISTPNQKVAIKTLATTIPKEQVLVEIQEIEVIETVYTMSLDTFVSMATVDNHLTEKRRTITSKEKH